MNTGPDATDRLGFSAVQKLRAWAVATVAQHCDLARLPQDHLCAVCDSLLDYVIGGTANACTPDPETRSPEPEPEPGFFGKWST